MEICLTGWTALECWRKLREGGKAYLELFMQQNHRVLKATAAPRLPTERALHIAERFGLSMPLHVAVLPRPRRRNSMAYQTHALAERGFVMDVFHLDEDLVLAHPNDVFMKLAGEGLSTPKLAQVGFELCSRYTLRSGDRKITESRPLIDPAELLKECEARKTLAQRNALSSLRYVLPNSESPAETEMALKLVLPTSWGGFGLVGAELNPMIPLGSRSQAIYEHGHCRADMLFKSIKLDVEYDGAEWHTSPEQRISDLKRWQALSNEGFTVINVDASRLRDSAAMEKIARRIKSLKGERFRVRSKDFRTSQTKLYAYLASSSMLVQTNE